MTLLAELLGVVLGGVAVSSLAAGLLGARMPWSGGVLLVVVGVAAVLFCDGAWSLIQPMPAATRADTRLSKQAAESPEAPLVNTAFLAWARRVITQTGRNETFWLTPSAAADPLTYQWTTYQLLPAREASLVRATWIVIYGANPPTTGFAHTAFRRVLTYGSGYALAERTDAG
jgi:hypothetical protein